MSLVPCQSKAEQLYVYNNYMLCIMLTIYYNVNSEHNNSKKNLKKIAQS